MPLPLQLISASRNRPVFLALRLLRHLRLHLLRGLPVQRLQTLRQNRVREVVAGKHPVRVHGAQVLDLQLDQGAGEFGTVAERAGEGIGLELEAAAQNVHQELDDVIHRAQDVREEQEPNDDGVLVGEAEVGVERVVVDEDREEGEHVEEVGLSGY